MQIALENLDTVDACNAQLSSEGLTTKSMTTGMIRAHPCLNIKADATATFVRTWRMLGLDYYKTIDGVPLEKLRAHLADADQQGDEPVENW